MGALLGLAAVGCVASSLWLTTDAYHTVLFFGFGVACLVGAIILLWRATRS